jgi:type IV pilus assembly protein PilQ
VCVGIISSDLVCGDEFIIPPPISHKLSVPPFATNLIRDERKRREQVEKEGLKSVFKNIIEGDKRKLNKDARILSRDSNKLDRFLGGLQNGLSEQIAYSRDKKNVVSCKMRRLVGRVYNDPMLMNKRISLSLKKADIRDAVELIAKSTQLNFIVDSNVVGIVENVHFNQVRVGTALRLLLSTNHPHLALIKEDEVWRITLLSTAEELLQHNLEVDKENDFVTGMRVMHNVRWSEVCKMQMHTLWENLMIHKEDKQRSFLIINDETRKVFFRGRKKQVKLFRHFLRELDAKVPQIRIEARVVIADKNFEDSFGLQWSGIYNRKESVKKGFQFVSAGGNINDIQNDPKPLSNLMDWALNFFPSTWEKSRNCHLPIVFGGKDLNTRRLNLVLNAAESRNEIKTILKPAIMVSDRETAEILEGEVIPIETIVEESVEGRLRNVRTAQYKDVGIQFRVRPAVCPNRKSVLLDLFVENSMVDERNLNSTNHSNASPLYPTIITTRSKTRVMLANRQTTMISGLIRNRKKNEHSALPLLGRIPLIGWLFKGYRKVVSDLQLLIFITPTIIT